MNEVVTIGVPLVIGAALGYVVGRLRHPSPRDIVVDVKPNSPKAWEVRVSKVLGDRITWKVASGELDVIVKAATSGQVPYTPTGTGSERKSGPLSSDAKEGQENEVDIKIDAYPQPTMNGRIIIQK